MSRHDHSGGHGDDRGANVSSGASPTDTLGGGEHQTDSGANSDGQSDPGDEGVLSAQGPMTITGTAGDDILHGGSGNDSIDGAAGDDTIIAAHGDDTVTGGDGNDLIIGGHGDDTLDGGAGNDTIMAGHGNDTITGGDGDDLIRVGHGASIVDGGAGDDTIVAGGHGGDTLTGGDGDDLFVVHGGALGPSEDDLIHITDFTTGADKLAFGDDLHMPLDNTTFGTGTQADFASALADAQTQIANGDAVVAEQIGGDVVVFAAGDEGHIEAAVVLVGKTLADIAPSDIIG